MTDRPPPMDQNRFMFASLPGAISMLAKGLRGVNRPISPRSLSVVRRCPRWIPPRLLGICLPLQVSLLLGCGGAEAPGVTPDVMTSGPEDAPVLVVEFGDYQCGPCAALGRTLHALLIESPREIRFTFRLCPSRAHRVGRAAAIVAAAAAEDGSFWELHWRLVDQGPVTTEAQLWALVEEAGLDATRLRSVIASGRPTARLERDLAEADRLGIRGVPTTFIGGRIVEGTASLDRLRRIVVEVARNPHARR